MELPDDPDYHFLTDMTDQAVAWIRYQKALTPDRPFFIYFAPGATHAPHHVPKEWIARWEGKFDQGWDALRDEILVTYPTCPGSVWIVGSDGSALSVLQVLGPLWGLWLLVREGPDGEGTEFSLIGAARDSTLQEP